MQKVVSNLLSFKMTRTSTLEGDILCLQVQPQILILCVTVLKVNLENDFNKKCFSLNFSFDRQIFWTCAPPIGKYFLKFKKKQRMLKSDFPYLDEKYNFCLEMLFIL